MVEEAQKISEILLVGVLIEVPLVQIVDSTFYATRRVLRDGGM